MKRKDLGRGKEGIFVGALTTMRMTARVRRYTALTIVTSRLPGAAGITKESTRQPLGSLAS